MDAETGRELSYIDGVEPSHQYQHDTVAGNGVVGDNSNEPSQTRTISRYETRERFVITKNVIVIGLAFMIHFTAFHGTSNLQSSVNSDKALGTTTLAVIYGSLILSNILLPMTVIRPLSAYLCTLCIANPTYQMTFVQWLC
uniref:Uncharacterized protein n=1 Tax=Stomoxys calcitrans TaxID=35570 RepID=A0A1I8Q8V3_STOCA